MEVEMAVGFARHLLYSPEGDVLVGLMDERVELASQILDYAWAVIAVKREQDGQRWPRPALIAFKDWS